MSCAQLLQEETPVLVTSDREEPRRIRKDISDEGKWKEAESEKTLVHRSFPNRIGV